MSPSSTHTNHQAQFHKLLILLFWLAIWQIGAVLVRNSILLVGPFEVVKALIRLVPESEFWWAVFNTFLKISGGFLGAFAAGILIGWIAYEIPFLQDFLAPVTMFIKSVPVASFVILALIWMGSKNLSVFISFLVVFPMIYSSTVAGLSSTDGELLEMAEIFHITGWRKIRALYWPALLPYLKTSCRTALGMSWKSGIAAEVIGVPDHTIGERLYMAKIYLSTAELFAWTLTIIVVSAVFEKVVLWGLGLTDSDRLLLPVKAADGVKKPCDHSVEDRPTPVEITRHSAHSGRTDLHQPEQKTISQGIQIQGLSKSYGELSVLDNLTVNFAMGSHTCLMGASGSGKTTLLRIVAGLERAESGSCRLVSVSSISETSVSMVFQENRLCETFSPIDNLRLAVPSMSRSATKELLLKLLPEECLTRPVSTLSGGMKRRCAIARALAFPAPVVLMDEPFTGLDEGTKEQVIEVIQKWCQDRLLLVSTHQEEDVELLGAKLYRL